ncbi:MAG: hypothetical protein J6A75_10755 [Lachnospiraceae bacterium]|nr:hypothetical protein [Lachnospiraceae bacterium]
MLLEFEILEIYGNELKNGRCPEEIRKDLFIIMDFLNEPTTSNYMIKNGPRDIDSTASFYYDNEFDIAAGNLSPDKIKEIYTHLKIIANDVVISHRNMLTELYFKMLKF